MSQKVNNLPLIVVGGWGVDAAMLAPVVQNWPADVHFESLDEELITGRDSIPDVAECLTRRYFEPAVWLGWSQGSQVVMAAVDRDSSPVDSAVTIAGFPRFVEGQQWPCGMARDRFQEFEDSLSSNAPRTWRRFQQLMVHGCSRNERSEARRELMSWVERGPSVSDANLVKSLRWLAEEDQRVRWSHTAVPALHLLGSEDALVCPWHRALSLPECAESRVIPGMTHWPRAQHADECRQAMTEFFARQHQNQEAI